MPKVGMTAIRRQQLIDATIACIDRYGIANTTIKSIAQEASLSPSIISHYFGGKVDLLKETMLDLMRGLRQNIAKKSREEVAITPKRSIEIIIECNFDQTLSQQSKKVWLSFWEMSMHQSELTRLQKINYNRLHSNLLGHYKKMMSPPQAEIAASGLAAMIDGLWLHGCLQSEAFDVERARQVALSFFHNSIEQ